MQAIDKFYREHDLEEIDFEIECMKNKSMASMDFIEKEVYSLRMYDLYTRKDKIKKELENGKEK